MLNVKRIFSRLLLLAAFSLILPFFSTAMEIMKPESDPDKTLSPFFFVQSDNPEVDALPLKSTRADVTISGVIADVEVTQVYKNEGKNTLEAIYIFPASSRAAVYAMRMTIGERTIEAQIQEKQKARETYEKALAEGKTASLLEQQRPNVFQMNVGNILPGDEIKVKMNYTELLVPKDGVYEFVYPTVVGPRYSNQTEKTAGAQDKWTANPYLHEGKDAPFTFAFDLKLNSGIPIAKLTSPSHKLNIEYTGKTAALVSLPESNQTNNRDVVIQYSLLGDRIESGLLLNLDKKEDFFLLMLEPPQRVASSQIVPREYIFVIDVSGSMGGFPLNVSKSLIKDLLNHMRPSDFFNIMLFSGDNSVLAPKSLPATQANLRLALNLIDQQQGGGGTELMPALRAAMALPRAETNLSRSMIIITDGYVSVEKDAFDYIGKNLNQGNVFAFGIGSSVNRFLIEGLARAGMGEPFIVLNEKEAAGQAKKFREYIDSPVLTDIRVNFNGLAVSDVEPIAIPDLFAKKPVIVFGKYHGTPKGTVTVTGKTAGQPYQQEIRVSEGQISTQNKALRYLWARHRIIRLADMVKLTQDDQAVKDVTSLGLEYNLLTDYTSFVAVDTLKRTDGKPRDSVQQPLPLPQGVSDLAVGGGYASNSVMKCMAAPAATRSLAKEACLDETVCSVESEMAAPTMAGAVKTKKSEDKKTALRAQLQVETTEGLLTIAQAEQALQTHKSHLLYVVQQSKLSGAYRIEILLDGKGAITKINFIGDTFNQEALKIKVQRILERVKFIAASDKNPAKIILTISLP